MAKCLLEIDWTTIIVFISVICTLILQLWLCFKAKQIFTKLFPVVIFIALTIVFSVCSATINGWDGLGYLFFALLSFGLVLICGVGWGIWTVIRKRN